MHKLEICIVYLSFNQNAAGNVEFKCVLKYIEWICSSMLYYISYGYIFCLNHVSYVEAWRFSTWV